MGDPPPSAEKAQIHRQDGADKKRNPEDMRRVHDRIAHLGKADRLAEIRGLNACENVCPVHGRPIAYRRLNRKGSWPASRGRKTWCQYRGKTGTAIAAERGRQVPCP